MHQSPEALDLDHLVKYATELGLNAVSLRQCIEDGRYKNDIEQSVSEAQAKAVRGTPTFVIGKSTGTGVDGTLVVGAQPYSVFDNMLKDLLR